MTPFDAHCEQSNSVILHQKAGYSVAIRLALQAVICIKIKEHLTATWFFLNIKAAVMTDSRLDVYTKSIETFFFTVIKLNGLQMRQSNITFNAPYAHAIGLP